MKPVARIFALLILLSACGAPGAAPSQSPAPATTVPTSSLPATSVPTAPVPTTPVPATASPADSVRPSLGGDVTLVTHDSFAASDSVIADFEAQSGVTLKVLEGGDAGSVVNQAILTKANPLGDVLYGVDNTFLSRALDAGIFVPYTSPAAASVPAQFQLDPQGRVTPIDYGDVCVVYDLRAMGGTGSGIIPKRINDLTQPAYKGTFVVENPATSSPGLAFMLATIARFGESGDYTWLDYWRDLRANDVLVVSDWNDAYYNEFSGSGEPQSKGRPLVVSYATDPASSMVGAAASGGTPGVQFLDDGCFRQMEFVGVLAGAKNPAGAQAWIDFMASPEFQSDIPLNMYVLPTNPDAQLPELFTQFQSQATAPLTMDPTTIAANRDKWIQQWTDAVVH